MTGLFESQGQLALADGSAKLSKDSDLTDIGMVVKYIRSGGGVSVGNSSTRILHGTGGKKQTKQVLSGLNATLAQAKQENKIVFSYSPAPIGALLYQPEQSSKAPNGNNALVIVSYTSVIFP